MRHVALAFTAICALVGGCALGSQAASCGSTDVFDGGTNVKVHVDVLNDARYNGHVCFAFNGATRHDVKLSAHDSVPDVTHAYDGTLTGPQIQLTAWFAGSDAIFHHELTNASETWYTLVIGASSIQISAHHEPPVYD